MAGTPSRLQRGGVTVWTIGHSTRTLEQLFALLALHGIEAIADVRRFPGSRKQPWFGREAFEDALTGRGLEYRWIPALGGRRRPEPDSPNDGWRHPAFRAYADHVATEEFAEGLFELLMAAEGLRTAVMCAEVLWWRCHRRIIADVLVSLGVPVVHIRDARVAEPHRIAPPARIVGGRLTYAQDPRAAD